MGYKKAALQGLLSCTFLLLGAQWMREAFAGAASNGYLASQLFKDGGRWLRMLPCQFWFPHQPHGLSRLWSFSGTRPSAGTDKVRLACLRNGLPPIHSWPRDRWPSGGGGGALGEDDGHPCQGWPKARLYSLLLLVALISTVIVCALFISLFAYQVPARVATIWVGQPNKSLK